MLPRDAPKLSRVEGRSDIAGLDFAACERARYARDPAFDGVIFICVASTRIYCRPVCPARQPLTRNVHYVSSAAAAEAALLT